MFLVGLCVPVLSQEPAALGKDRNVFVFGGVYSSESVGETFNFIGTDYQGAYVLGAGYQQFFLGERGGLRFGGEYGVALRNGPDTSAEVWAGAVLRSDALIKTAKFDISASVTGGLSATTGRLDVETNRESNVGGGDSSVLFYMAPEISLSLTSNPNMEVFWRVHHRSGGWHTLGGMGEGSNANTLGVRWSF